ncbi:hypothetical protein V1477_019773 [Vespula maculifrons]|uniref:Uncharacterized protein n=1 Tax=Vespula maculifrons TaxID=7453 RepID=A0ABD2ARD5_VESMC
MKKKKTKYIVGTFISISYNRRREYNTDTMHIYWCNKNCKSACLLVRSLQRTYRLIDTILYLFYCVFSKYQLIWRPSFEMTKLLKLLTR